MRQPANRFRLLEMTIVKRILTSMIRHRARWIKHGRQTVSDVVNFSDHVV